MIQTDSLAPLWLHDRRYDLTWFLAVPIALAVVLLALGVALGPERAIAVYIASSLLTGLPHNWITWLMIMPRASREYYRAGALFVPLVLAAILIVPVVLFFGTPLYAWAITFTIVIAYHHITRQHQGILHSADARYVQATGDGAIRGPATDLRRLVGAFAAACAAWKLVGPPVEFGIVGAPMQFQIYPLPLAVPLACTALVLYFGARAFVGFYRRNRAGARFPVVHALVAGSAMGNLAVAALVPNAAFFVSLAIVASYHNAQYFAFCYTHHHLRATADATTGDPFSRWARDRRWLPWFGLPLTLGVAFGLAIAVLPAFWTAVLGYAFMGSHYFVDASIWRRKFYPQMGRFASGRVDPEAVLAPTP